MIDERSNVSLDNGVKKIIGELSANQYSLFIKRVPKKTKKKFQKLAEEFCDDYGMTLKFLMDGLLSEDMQQMVVKIEELESRLATLEKPKEPEQLTVTMCDGSLKRVKGGK